jgi:hypothetical protein
MKATKLVPTLLAVVLLVCAGARGELITVTFDGALDNVDTSLSGRFAVGDLMHVSITYESTTPDTWWSTLPGQGYYPAITAFEVSVNGYTATATSGYFAVFDNYPVRDVVEAVVQSFTDGSLSPPRVGTLVGDPVNEMNLWWFRLSLIDNSGTAVTSDALPTSFNPLLFPDQTRLSLEWRHITDYGTFNDSIDASGFTSTSTFPAVPVPGALLLAGLGLSTAGWMCRRRK